MSEISTQRPKHAVLELGLIVLLCYLFAGSPPPGVNESHYLGKAKHYWNPEWCRGDFFLESADAHLVFYWSFGWVTKFASLDATAWIGRLVTWSFFALSWRSLVSAITDTRWAALLTSMLLLPLVHYADLAGEWLVGGIEAKSFAWPLVFLGMARVCQGQWSLAWILFGLASSFHILVGGWAVVAALFAWVLRRRAENLSAVELACWLVIGGIFALPGLIPALQLSAHVSAEEIQEANITYTFRRLSHHLVPYLFPWENIIAFSLLTAAWWYAAKRVALTERLIRLRAIVLGSLAIAACGIAIDVFTGLMAGIGTYTSIPIDASWFQNLRASLLRYYFFRLSDVLVPVGMSVVLVTALTMRELRIPRLTGAIVFILAALGIGRSMGTIGFAARSTAVQKQVWPNVTEDVSVEQITAAWYDACRWIRHSNEVPPSSVFLTPPRQQTFKWYAQRPIVLSWKDVPQDAIGLNAWWQRQQDVYLLGDWPWNDPKIFANITATYGITHVIWPDSFDHPHPERATEIYRNELFRVFVLEQ